MSNIGSHRGVVDEGRGGTDNSGGSSNDSSSSNKSKMGSLSLSNLGGILNWLGCNSGIYWGNKGLRVESWGNKRLRVEGGSNSVIDGSNGETRVSNTESCSVSNILNLLQLSSSINIRVSSRNPSVGVTNNMSIGVDVGIAVVQVAELILSVELTSSSVRSISSIGWGSSSIGHRGSSNRGSNRGSSSNLCVGKASIISIGQRRCEDLGLLGQAYSHKSRQGNKNFHDVTRY